MTACASWKAVGVGKFWSGAWNGELATISFSGVADDSLSVGSPFTHPKIDAALPSFDCTPSGASGTTTHTTVSYGVTSAGAFNETSQGVILEALWAYVNALKIYQPAEFRWTELRLSALLPDNKVLNGATVATITSPVAGTGSAGPMPPQSACVASLRTGGRGAHNKGRVYVPTTIGNVMGSDQLVSATVGSNIRTATKTFIDACNALGNVRCAVVSRTKHTYSDISDVASGDELDTQRRRRNGRNETYSHTAVTS